MSYYTAPYTAADMGSIIDLAQRAIPSLPNYQGVTVDPKKLGWTLSQNINNAMFYCLLLFNDKDQKVVGGICAAVATSHFSNDVIARDIFLWVDPEHRSLPNANMLIKAYVQWGKDRKAKRIMASYTSGLGEEGMANLLKRNGFEHLGELFAFKQ